MNIISKTQDENGTIWAICACSNTFMIVYKMAGEKFWLTNSEVYNEPDPAIKALKRRVETINRAVIEDRQTAEYLAKESL